MVPTLDLHDLEDECLLVPHPKCFSSLALVLARAGSLEGTFKKCIAGSEPQCTKSLWMGPWNLHLTS